MRKLFLRYLILQLSWKFLIKIEFFNNKVIIIYECVLDEFFNGVIELVGNVLVSVAILKSQQPQIKLLHVSINQTFKGLITRKHDANGTGQEGKEGKSDELDQHAVEVFDGGGAVDVSVTDSGDCLKHEIKSIYVDALS